MLHSLIYERTSLLFLLPVGIAMVGFGGWLAWYCYEHYKYYRDNRIWDEEDYIDEILESKILNDDKSFTG